MISRRSFLAGALTAAPLLSKTRSKPWGCDLPTLNHPFVPPSNGRKLVPNESYLRARPILSKLHGCTLHAYRSDLKRGYREMAKRSLADPNDCRGLAYHAWLHDYYCFAHPSIHDDWRFLPWHRAFLYFHEKTLQGIVGKHFRLGVWDWDESAKIPGYYIQSALEFSSCDFIDDLTAALPISECLLEAWLLPGNFQGDGHATPGAFGGPHSMVHSKCTHILSDFRRAAMHPLFYAHHANVDRFWSFWRQHRPGGLVDDSGWLGSKMDFYDEHGDPVYVCVKDLLETEPLGYSASPVSTMPDYGQYGGEPLTGQRSAHGATAHFDVKKLRPLIESQSLANLSVKAPSYPGSVRANLTGTCVPVAGTYYYVILKAGSTMGPIIGGFGWFAMGAHGTDGLVVTSCFSISAIQFIIQYGGDVSFAWGPPNSNDITTISGVGCPMTLVDDVRIFVKS